MVGHRTIERYQLCDQIAAGGMGSVHLGHLQGSAGFGRIVAIKRLHPEFAANRDFVESFTQEARLAARIRHPNVVPILDALSDGKELFLVLEYVHGEPFHKLLDLKEQRPAPIAIAAAIVRGMLEGLHAAHHAVDERGALLEIVHRDVSPQNILVGVDGLPRLLDFGVATATNREVAGSTTDRKGKLSYMAPEQIVTGAVSPRADVYSAAVVLWEALTGRRLFTSGLPLTEILDTPIVPPSQLNDAVSPALEAVVMRGLERNPALRWSSAREMSLELERATPIATEREIGHWVSVRASVTLKERAAQIAFIERSFLPSLHPALPHQPQFGEFDGGMGDTTARAIPQQVRMQPNAILTFSEGLDLSSRREREVVITTRRELIDLQFDEVPAPTRILLDSPPPPSVVDPPPSPPPTGEASRRRRTFAVGALVFVALAVIALIWSGAQTAARPPVTKLIVSHNEPIRIAPMRLELTPPAPAKPKDGEPKKRSRRAKRGSLAP